MKLQKITIKNFRSIKSEEILIDNNCLILLGKNEAGKSNVLKAIAALFNTYTVTNKDKRKKLANENIIDYCISAEFEYSESDYDSICTNLNKKYPSIKDITFRNGKQLSDYIKAELAAINLFIDIKDNQKALFKHNSEKQSDVLLEKDIYQNGNVLSFSPNGAKIELHSLIVTELQTIYNKNPYKCIFWHYDNNLLLPPSINRDQFVATPSNCKALENLFIMCNRSNIEQEFKEAREQDGDFDNLLDQVSKTVTSTFQKIWKDFKDTSILLSSDGNDIRIKVVNKAKYSFEDRSDGFKKFISILLMLSTQARSNKIGERDIILIDEPDQSLYPTSAKYLRDELLKISEKSHVIYSTHSQYMIDSNCLKRHLIIEKKDDITTIHKETGVAPYCDDELLRRAIGCSVFECLKEKNIIFEGWTDKELFIKYCFFNRNEDLKNIGITFLHGISGAEALASLMISANKKFIIVADSDQTSKNKRKDFISNFPDDKGSWLEYDECDNGIKTLEDFIDAALIENVIKEMGNRDFQFDNSKKAIDNIEKCITEKEKRQECKKRIIQKVEKANIKDKYIAFIQKLKDKLEAL